MKRIIYWYVRNIKKIWFPLIWFIGALDKLVDKLKKTDY